jgi:bacteriocin biosynthesis cyclodehydratase domain-containing protein
MKLEFLPQASRLRALRAQLIETDDGAILKRGRAEVKIRGARAAETVAAVVLAAADGATVDDICEQFAPPDRSAVERLVRELEARRFLVSSEEDPAPNGHSGPQGPESHLDLLYWHFGAQAEEVAKRLSERRITVVGVNYISRQLAAALAATGVGNVEIVDYTLLANLRLLDEQGAPDAAQWPATVGAPTPYQAWTERLDPETLGCVVATTDFGGLQLLRSWNEFCVRHNCHFLPVALRDLVGYVGPLVVPGETACYECLRARQNSHLADPATRRATEAVAFEGQAVSGFHPSMASILGDIAALELVKFYAGWPVPRIVGTLIEVNLLATEMAARKVLKMPRCRVCSPMLRHGTVAVEKQVLMPGHEVYT